MFAFGLIVVLSAGCSGKTSVPLYSPLIEPAFIASLTEGSLVSNIEWTLQQPHDSEAFREVSREEYLLSLRSTLVEKHSFWKGRTSSLEDIKVAKQERWPSLARPTQSKTMSSKKPVNEGAASSSARCPCSGANNCYGPRGGRYCITSTG